MYCKTNSNVSKYFSCFCYRQLKFDKVIRKTVFSVQFEQSNMFSVVFELFLLDDEHTGFVCPVLKFWIVISKYLNIRECKI